MNFNDRWDKDLPFLLKFENIAWYEDGKVSILDRRVYPREITKVVCTTYQEVAQAIKDMVTQSEGPYIAANHGIVLAVHQGLKENVNNLVDYVKTAAKVLTTARPTTQEQMQRVIENTLKAVSDGVKENLSKESLINKVNQVAFDFANNNYKKYSIIGENLANLIQDGSTVLTQCFGGTIVGTMLRALKNSNKVVKMVCCETRPYYQGSRLTASVCSDMGFDTTVICDNMPGFLISQNKIDVFTSASDVITLDGHVINKVGTFQIASLCKEFNVPYYVAGTPEPKHKDISTVKIEERDGELVTMSLDTKITNSKVKGYYPAFDITPPEKVTAIVTDKGVFSPSAISSYLK